MNGAHTYRYRLLIGYARRQGRMLALIAGLMVAAAGVAALQPLPVKVLVDYGLRGSDLPGWLRTWFERADLGSSPGELIVFAAVLGMAVFLLQSVVDTAMTWA